MRTFFDKPINRALFIATGSATVGMMVASNSGDVLFYRLVSVWILLFWPLISVIFDMRERAIGTILYAVILTLATILLSL